MAVIVTCVAFFMYLMQGVLCNNQWKVVMPGSIRAIRESCATVPCRFQTPSSFDGDVQPNCSAIWLRGRWDGPPVFNSRKPNIRNGIKGELKEDLRQRVCTTVFHNLLEEHNDTYFFRLECPSPSELKYTFTPGVYISSHADPPPPELTTTPRRDLVERESVRIRCKAPVPCHGQVPAISWMPPMEGMNIGEAQMDTAENGLITLTSTLTFKATPSYHDSTITCSVRYPQDQGLSVQAQTLTVQFAPQVTTATQTPPGPIRIGQAVTLTCSSEANPPVERYSWFIDDRGQLRRTAEGERLLLLASLDDSQVYVCEARNSRGSDRSRPIALELDLTLDRSGCFSTVPYIMCAVLLVFYTLTVMVALFKCHRLSRRLKHLELKGKEEHTYTALRASSVARDYDRIQRQAAPQTPEVPSYENPISALGLSERP